jgi:hypothetical protein
MERQAKAEKYSLPLSITPIISFTIVSFTAP